MSNPSMHEIQVRGFLQDASILMKNEEEDLIADKVALLKDGVSKKAKIAKYRVGEWFRDEAGIRAPGTEANRADFNIDEVNIDPKQYAMAKEVHDEDVEAENHFNPPPLNNQQDAIQWNVNKIDLKKEIRVASLIESTTWADGNATGEDAAGLWAPGGSNTFIADVRRGKHTVRGLTGKVPNTLVIDYQTFESLAEEATIAEKIKYTQLGVITPQLIAALVGVNEVLVGKAIKNTANEKEEADAFTASNIWETNADKGGAFLFYKPKQMGLKTAAALGQFRTKMPGGRGRLTSSWREQSKHQWVYETAEDTDITVMHANLGFQWIDTFAT